jgi:sulfonate transport system substrate-binding protein
MSPASLMTVSPSQPARRHFLRFAAVGAVAAGMGALGIRHWLGSGQGSADAALKFGSFRGGDDLFADEAAIDTLKTQRFEFPSSALALQALTAGAIDITHFSAVTPVTLPETAPIKQIAAFPAAPRIMKVFATSGSGIRSLDQIRGKRVCYMRAGPLHLYLLELLKSLGLELDDIEAIHLPAADGLAAFAAGRVDVLLAGMYAICHQAEQLGARILLTGDQLPGFARLNGNVFAVHDAVLNSAKRALIPHYLKRTELVWRWIDTHPAQWASRMATLTHAPADYILANRTRPSGSRFLPYDEAIAAQQEVADIFFHSGLLPKPVDMASHWERGLLPQ